MKKLLCTVMLFVLLLSAVSCRPINVSEGDGDETEISFTVEYAKNSANTDGKTVVCIDAGHGFGDVGCTSDYLGCYEYEVTIDAARKLKAALEARGAEVVLTHDGVSFPAADEIISGCKKYRIEYIEEKIVDNDKFSAYERAIYEEILAKEYMLDFFISLHVNSVGNADYVDGYELYYCNSNPYVEQVEHFGETLAPMLDNDLKVVGYDQEESYLVTKYASIPSVLLEMGYATNPIDASKMKNEEWKTELAEILADEIIASVKQVSHTKY
ncbi:MAG: N-acetylmuramoyl-L-alanine amidase [Clostridia bacterium]|nr:N-acetylmuramoyl-L-alanine amidase [Clostridia bacterium]